MNLRNKELILFWCILDFGKGSKLLKLSNELGGVGGAIFLGRGTVKNELLNILGILDTRKEIFLTVIDEELEDVFYDEISKKFGLNKPRHGIAFSMPINYYLKVNGSKNVSNPEKKGVSNLDYESIFVIVDKGSIDDVLEAAELAGSTGGTIIHGRGSGTKEKEKLFNIQIEPEKEIILILSKADKTESIVNAIQERLNIDEPSGGIIFVMDVKKAVGLYQK
ncbi:P-II family nitrogen regulator [Tissierella praeacuta]|uniref:P-II family nitrogen regulator n=1 Tax=Tissierella praeacuta TaxID=43131 RepID=UPI00334286CC